MTPPAPSPPSPAVGPSAPAAGAAGPNGSAEELLRRATEAYERVDADPSRHGPAAAALVEEARRRRSPVARARALRAQAWYERSRLADGRARDLLDEAVRIARRQRRGELVGALLTTRAAVRQELGDLAGAERDLARAADLVDPAEVAPLELQQAVLHHNRGHLAEAAAVYARILGRPGVTPTLAAKVANNLAMVEGSRGATGRALQILDGVDPQGIGPGLRASLLQTRGWVLVQGGRLPEGLRLLDEAAAGFAAAGLPLGELHTESVDALLDLRLVPEARAAARRAVADFTAAGVPLMGADALVRLARLALLADDPPAAEAAAGQAASSLDAQRRPVWAEQARLLGVQARLAAGTAVAADLRTAARAARVLERGGLRSPAVEAHLVAGRVALALARPRSAREPLARAAELARDAPVLVRVQGRVAAALGGRAAGDDRAVLLHCRAGLADLVAHRSALPSMELRALASGHGTELGRLALAVRVREGRPAAVLVEMERTRAAALLVVEPPQPDAVQDDLAALRAVAAELDEASRAGQPEPRRLLARQATLEGRVRRRSWHAPRTGGGSYRPAGDPVPLDRVRPLLGDRLLVEYAVLDGDLLAVVLGRRSRLVRLGTLADVHDALGSLHFALRRLARPGAQPGRTGARLSADASLDRLAELLVAPLGLPADRPLVVVPVAGLHQVPWASLHPAAVALAPSASFWAATAQSTPPAAGPVVLVAGPGLPGAVEEVEALRLRHPGATVLVPPDSGTAPVAAALAGARLAHLACHCRPRADNPSFSALTLADGPLTVLDLVLHGVAPHRIVLAACSSGADVSYAGNETVGFVSALIAQGTAGVLASTVAVPDVAAVRLMTALHDRLATGATTADALHAARATLDPADPADLVVGCAFNAFGAA